jgi:hypothetical protein
MAAAGRNADMTGSSLAPIVIPVAVAISLATWIFVVYFRSTVSPSLA